MQAKRCLACLSWSARMDSNHQPPDLKAGVSACWTTGGLGGGRRNRTTRFYPPLVFRTSCRPFSSALRKLWRKEQESNLRRCYPDSELATRCLTARPSFRGARERIRTSKYCYLKAACLPVAPRGRPADRIRTCNIRLLRPARLPVASQRVKLVEAGGLEPPMFAPRGSRVTACRRRH